MAGYPQGFGAPVPWNSVDAQLSDGNSTYNALTFNLSKRFSKGFELLSSYTFSHSIDDSTDLQSPLEPQDSRFPRFERANSVNDQRHRWVTSAVFQSASAKSGDGAFKHFFGDFTLSPIVEFSSGRPFNVITGEDTRLDLGASQARPSIGSGAGTTSTFIPGVTFVPANVCLANSGSAFTVPFVAPPAGCTGSLGRDRFVMPNFFEWDMRLSRRIPLGERLKFDVFRPDTAEARIHRRPQQVRITSKAWKGLRERPARKRLTGATRRRQSWRLGSDPGRPTVGSEWVDVRQACWSSKPCASQRFSSRAAAPGGRRPGGVAGAR
jgi:hypothetical protein